VRCRGHHSWQPRHGKSQTARQAREKATPATAHSFEAKSPLSAIARRKRQWLREVEIIVRGERDVFPKEYTSRATLIRLTLGIAERTAESLEG